MPRRSLLRSPRRLAVLGPLALATGLLTLAPSAPAGATQPDLAGTAGATGVTTVAASSPAVAAGASYVALGDSYSSGAGLTPYRVGSPPECLRSTLDYSGVVAKKLKLALIDVACSGAATADLTRSQYPDVPPQLAALGPSTALVTMTLGGNDGGLFGDFVGSCEAAAATTGGTGNPCQQANGDRFDRTIDAVTLPNLVAALTQVRAAAPNARVMIIGYPRILPPTTGCWAAMPFATGDVAYLFGIEKHLVTAVSQAAAQAGVDYVDTWRVSAGNDACADPTVRWIEPVNGGTNPMVIHPNARGEQAIARQVLKALGAA